MKNPLESRPQSNVPEDIAARMNDIVRKHASGYRQDLPGLIESMRRHAETVSRGDSWIEAMPQLKREAHDMKGQAATFGLPGLSSVAQSLCWLLDRGSKDHPGYAEAVNFHVAALARLADADDPALITEARGKTRHILGEEP